jgi:pSer/pThr/pTyr-binding forkhead associated (FHA) protein
MSARKKQVAAQLIVHFSNRAARLFSLQRGQTYTLGCDPECDILLEDEHVASRHARLESTNGDWRLVNLDDVRGTAVGGRKITSILLQGSTWISLGGLLVELQDMDAG